MKKFVCAVAALVMLAFATSSCRVHKGCEAYSKVEVQKKAQRV